MFCVLEAADQSDTRRTARSTARLGTDYNLCKTYQANGNTKSTDFPTWFYLYESYDFNGLAELYPKLEKWSKIPNVLLVRSLLKNKYEPREKFQRNKAAFDEMHLSKLITLDIDSVELDRSIPTNDLSAQASFIFNKILYKLDPATFPKGLSYIIQASSSSGVKSGVRAHFFIEADIKVTQGQLFNYFTELNKKYRTLFQKEDSVDLIDLSYYDAAHAQFVADPIFEGFKDPYKNKSRFHYHIGRNILMSPPRDLVQRQFTMAVTAEQVDEFMALQQGSEYMTDFMRKRLDWFKTQDAFIRRKVIAMYHDAYQECFNLDRLEGILRPIIREKREKLEEHGGWNSVDGYISQGKAVCIGQILANVNRVIPPTYGTAKIEIIPTEPSKNIKIPRGLEIPKRSSITIMKASLGAGKTTRVQDWWESGEIKTMLTLTDNISLVESNASRFGGKSFNSSAKNSKGFEDSGKENIEVYRLGTNDFKYPISMLSGTVQSVKRIEGCRFDMIFIDEADSVMRTILTCSTMGSDLAREEAVLVLTKLFEHSDRIVLADGDMCEETVHAWLDLIGTKPHLFRIDHMTKSMKTDVAYEHRTENSVWNQVLSDSSLGKTCLVVTDLGPDDLNKRKIWLENQPHNPKVAVIHAESKLDTLSVDLLGRTYRFNPDDPQSLSRGLVDNEIDVLLTSPSISGGVDWYYFDSTYGIVKWRTAPPNKRFQALRRDRREGREYHYYCKTKRSHRTGFEHINVSQEEMPILHYRTKLYLQTTREMVSYRANLRQLFMKEGCKVISINSIEGCYAEDLADADFKNKQNKVDIMQRVTGAPRPENRGKGEKEIKAPEGFNNAWHMKQLARAFYNVETDEISDETLMQFLDDKPHKAAEYFDNLLNHFYEPIMECLQKQSANPLIKYFNADKHAEANFTHISGDLAPSSVEDAKAVFKRCGVDLELPLTKSTFEFYQVYVGLNEFKTIPEKLHSFLYDSKVESIGDL